MYAAPPPHNPCLPSLPASPSSAVAADTRLSPPPPIQPAPASLPYLAHAHSSPPLFLCSAMPPITTPYTPAHQLPPQRASALTGTHKSRDTRCWGPWPISDVGAMVHDSSSRRRHPPPSFPPPSRYASFLVGLEEDGIHFSRVFTRQADGDVVASSPTLISHPF